MRTRARARGLASCARERALGDGVFGRWGRGSGDGAGERQSEVEGAQLKLAATNSTATATRASARCAILIGSNAIRNLRIPLKVHDMFFSNRSKIACLRARFAQVSRSKNHDSRGACRDSRFTNHQSLLTNHAFLSASFHASMPHAAHSTARHSSLVTRHFLIASFSAVVGWSRKFTNQEIGVPRVARRADATFRTGTVGLSAADKSSGRITSHESRVTNHESRVTPH